MMSSVVSLKYADSTTAIQTQWSTTVHSSGAAGNDPLPPLPPPVNEPDPEDFRPDHPLRIHGRPPRGCNRRGDRRNRSHAQQRQRRTQHRGPSRVADGCAAPG